MTSPSLSDWQEWGQRCACERCEPETQQALMAFAAARFHRYLRRYASMTSLREVAAAAPSAREAWQRFESYLALSAEDGVKARKAWLFERVSREGTRLLDAIQGGATLIMRDVVRDYLRRECPRPATLSLDAPVTGGGQDVTLAELLPDALNVHETPEWREAHPLAETISRHCFPVCSVRERIALLARHCGLSLAHPEVTRLAGCGKSVLYDSYRGVLLRLAEAAKREICDEDPELLLAVTLMAVDRLQRLAHTWARSEKCCAPFFCSADEVVDAGA